MKKLFLVLAVIFVCFGAKAQQFTNPGFETWSAGKPQGWSSIELMGITLSDIAKSSDSHSGDYSVKVAPKMMNATLAAMLQTEPYPMSGMLTNGAFNFELLMQIFANGGEDLDYMQMLADVITGGLPVSPENQPTSINGYFKFISQETGFFELTVLLISEENEQRTIVGLGAYYSDDMGMEYKTDAFQSFEMPIYYLSETPATEIVFMAMVDTEDLTPTVYPELYLDDITIEYSSVSLEEVANAQEITVYPNPTNGKIRINCENNSHIQIVNPLGQVVKQINNYTTNSLIEIEQKGIYFVRVNGEKATKLIVK